MDMAKVVKAYIALRDKRAEIKKAYEEQDAEFERKMSKLEEALLSACKDNDIESLRTTYGTATRVVRERVWAADWDAFKEFVREHDAIDLLEKRVHQGNFKEWAEAHPDVLAPVNIDRRYAISVRRAT
jgi:hypothetical protein